MDTTILIVEDEEDILDLLQYALQNDGYDTIGCIDTKNVQNILDEEDVDLILMDRNLPSMEGCAFVSLLRKQGYNNPVIYLSAKDKNSDIIEGFSSGGDDYITKPFDIDELKARIKAVIKRASKIKEFLKCQDILYNSLSKQFFINNKKVELTHLQHDLLLEFLKNQDILLSREILLQNVWNDGDYKQNKTVNVAIKRLKEKIDPDGKKNYIKTIRGEGYIMSSKACK